MRAAIRRRLVPQDPRAVYAGEDSDADGGSLIAAYAGDGEIPDLGSGDSGGGGDLGGGGDFSVPVDPGAASGDLASGAGDLAAHFQTDVSGALGSLGGGLGGDVSGALGSLGSGDVSGALGSLGSGVSGALGTDVSGALGSLSQGDVSGALGQLSGATGTLGQLGALGSDVSGAAQSLASGDISGALGQAQSGLGSLGSALGSVGGGLGSALGSVGSALGSVQGIGAQFSSGDIGGGLTSGAKALLGAAKVAQAAIGGDSSHLLSPEGAAASAQLIGQALSSGDWEQAGTQAVDLIQRSSSQPSTPQQALDVTEGAVSGILTGIAIGVAIGSALAPYGIIIGAVVGAIVGTIIALTQIHHQPSTQDELNGANSIQDQYENGGASWFKTGRTAYFKQVPVWYAKSITDGLTPWDLVMNGGESNGINRPLMKLDYALWLAVNGSDLQSFVKSADPTLQSTIYPLMPMAIFTVSYLCYVPVLAAPGCYSPLAIQAIRDALTAQLTKSGPQVQAIAKASLPSDDLTLLLYAYHFVDCQGERQAGNRPAHLLDYIAPRTDVWGPRSPTVTSLEKIIAQCATLNGGSPTAAKQLIANINATIQGAARLDAGETLNPGQSLVSPNGTYTLAFQGDGNLVLYKGPSQVLWASNTPNKGATALAMQSDGNLVIYAGSSALWATNTPQPPGGGLVDLFVQNDGNVVLYEEPAIPIWSTNTADGSTSSGVPISDEGIHALNAAVDALPSGFIADCLTASGQVSMKRGHGGLAESFRRRRIAREAAQAALAAPSTPGGGGLAKAMRRRHGYAIPLAATAAPTISLAHAHQILAHRHRNPQAHQFITGTVASAQGGHPTGIANAEVLSLAQRLQVQAAYVGKYVGPQQAAQIAKGLHMTSPPQLPLGRGLYDKTLPLYLEQAVTAMKTGNRDPAQLRQFAEALDPNTPPARILATTRASAPAATAPLQGARLVTPPSASLARAESGLFGSFRSPFTRRGS